ncbi:MAG TPA: hypothetical protein VJ860_23185, partial [Polyangia bacterium]|nr:hypothetical protein [Polyangia bacterium]
PFPRRSTATTTSTAVLAPTPTPASTGGSECVSRPTCNLHSGAAGLYEKKITLYASGKLVWGTEP